MLPRHARLTSPNDFARATKSGLRQTSKSLVLYFYTGKEVDSARFGLIISKSIGGSVARHRVARKLRHCLRDHINKFPAGSLVVVRALPQALKTNLEQELSSAVALIIEKSAAVR